MLTVHLKKINLSSLQRVCGKVTGFNKHIYIYLLYYRKVFVLYFSVKLQLNLTA